jgi:hypothetical protein
VEHRDPLVAAGPAHPVTADEARTAILPGLRPDQGVSPAGGAKAIPGMVIVMRRAWRGGRQALPPTMFGLSGHGDGAGLSHGDLLIV